MPELISFTWRSSSFASRLFDDLLKAVVLIANDAPVAGRVFEPNTQNRTSSAGVVMVLDELLQRLELDHRHVAGQHQHERI